MQNKLNINTIPDDFLLRNIIKISIEIFMSILTLSWVTEVHLAYKRSCFVTKSFLVGGPTQTWCNFGQLNES